MAVTATFALKAGVWSRRACLVMALLIRGILAAFRQEILLSSGHP